jgi:tetratricopeptide (TPR) repeat protein
MLPKATTIVTTTTENAIVVSTYLPDEFRCYRKTISVVGRRNNEERIAIDEKSLGPDHPNVAIRLNNLTGLFRSTNRLAEAEVMYRRALAIDEKSSGTDHPTSAIRLKNLAGLLRAMNRFVEAKRLYRHALTIDEMSFGSEHPRVAITLKEPRSVAPRDESPH